MEKAKWNNLTGKTIKDKYYVQREIGSGGAGKVYLAINKKTNKKVALKTCDPRTSMSDPYARFKLESKVLSQLSHPNIIKFYESFKYEDVEIIAMEYVEGISLKTKMRNEKMIEISDALKYVGQLLNALSEVHKHKIYHRDIKPENIHITTLGNIKLLDFGIVQESVEQELTRQGSIIGTLSYLAPELIKNPEKKSNEKTDIYSAGVILYEMLTDVKPYVPDSEIINTQEKNNNLGSKIVFQPFITPQEINFTISDEVNYFICKLMDKQPSERYENTSAALRDLKIIQNGGTLEDIIGIKKNNSIVKNNSEHKIMIYTIIGAGLIFIIVVTLLVML